MAAGQVRLAFEALRHVEASAFTGAYQNLGAVTAHPIRIFKITNNTAKDVTVSFDGGTTDHEYVPAGSFVLIDATANRSWDCAFALGANVQVAIKSATASGVAGTFVYMSCYYGI